MIPVERILTANEIAFLRKHEIPLTTLFDARGMSKDERRTQMRRLNMSFAIGSPCNDHGHRLRTSAGHCIMCDTKRIAFSGRHRSPGQVYVARSVALALTKVGSAIDAASRIAQLNSERYGGGRDWHLVGMYSSDEAGKVESSVHQTLSGFRAKRTYQKDGALIDCYELFSCPANVAIQALQEVLGLSALPSQQEPITPPSPAQQPRKSLTSAWQKGDRVKHPLRPEWGVGTLIADGSNDRIEVNFHKVGNKILVPSMAKLIRLTS